MRRLSPLFSLLSPLSPLLPSPLTHLCIPVLLFSSLPPHFFYFCMSRVLCTDLQLRSGCLQWLEKWSRWYTKLYRHQSTKMKRMWIREWMTINISAKSFRQLRWENHEHECGGGVIAVMVGADLLSDIFPPTGAYYIFPRHFQQKHVFFHWPTNHQGWTSHAAHQTERRYRVTYGLLCFPLFILFISLLLISLV